MDQDDTVWIAQLKAGHDPALVALRVALLKNLRRALANHPRADDSFLEDVVQDALLRILDRLDQFAGRSRFLTWATALAIHVALGQLRRHRWQDVSLDDVIAGHGAASPHADNAAPDVHAQRGALLAALDEAIEQQLTPRQRIALVAELKGMPQEEIARRLGSNRNAIYKLTHDARKKLKKHLEAAGYTADDIVATSAD